VTADTQWPQLMPLTEKVVEDVVMVCS